MDSDDAFANICSLIIAYASSLSTHSHTCAFTMSSLYKEAQGYVKHLAIFRVMSFPQRHVLNLLAQRPPIISLELRILNTLLTPILMQPADMVL